MLHRREQVHKRGRDVVDRPLQFGDHGTEIRDPVPLNFAHRVAGQVLKAGMLVPLTDDGTHDGAAIGRHRQFRQQFAEMDAGHGCLNGLKLAANFGWSVGLQVECVLMWQPSGQIDHDHGFVSGGRGRGR